jgi:dTDP-4-dehydrorhamnose 3,5-epimerase
MSVVIRDTSLAGVLVMEPRVFGDARGYLFESWQAERSAALGLPPFVQDNVSRSERGVLRGLHVQFPHPQGKLVQVLDGEVFDVAVDVRGDSPTFGQWVGYRLSADNHRQLYLPPGMAHGFCVLSASALLTYKCTDVYHPEAELTIAWDDPDIGIDWPVAEPTLSPKDASATRLRELMSRLVP